MAGQVINHIYNETFYYSDYRAVKIDPDFGDAWAYKYRFELQHGTEVL